MLDESYAYKYHTGTGNSYNTEFFKFSTNFNFHKALQETEKPP